jgi:phosphate transport system protein
MALYEERLQEDLNYIREQVHAMGDMVEQALSNAIHALLTCNKRLANDTVLADHPINRKMREIDRLCHGFIARHLPSGGHLRLISSILRINIQLERVGDYAVTISRESLHMDELPEGIMAHEMESIANEAKRIFNQALTAFYDDNAEMARATMVQPDSLQASMDGVYKNLMSGQYSRSSEEMFAVSVVLSQLKRMADQAKNICEETIFAVTGETKAKKVYNILFVDEENSCLSQMAEAIARKNHPNSGVYSSGGSKPAKEIDHTMVEFLDQHGFDLTAAAPKPLELSPQELAELHVIISLESPIKSYFAKVPFHTTCLNWNLGEIPDDATPEQTMQRYEEIYRELSFQIKELMELLRGEGAD